MTDRGARSGTKGSDERRHHVRGRLEAEQVEVGAGDVGQARIRQVVPELHICRQARAADGHRHRRLHAACARSACNCIRELPHRGLQNSAGTLGQSRLARYPHTARPGVASKILRRGAYERKCVYAQGLHALTSSIYSESSMTSSTGAGTVLTAGPAEMQAAHQRVRGEQLQLALVVLQWRVGLLGALDHVIRVAMVGRHLRPAPTIRVRTQL